MHLDDKNICINVLWSDLWYITMYYLPSGDEIVVVDDEVSRSIQVGNEKSEDDIDGEEKVNDEINGRNSSISSFLES